jgi:DNA-binding ferritin-like protein
VGAEVARALGRVEKQLDRVESKLDGHSERITALEVRVDRHDIDIAEAKSVEQTEQHHGVNGRQMIAAAVVSVLGGGLMTLLVTLLTSHR